MTCELIGGPLDGNQVEVDFEYLRYGGEVQFTEAWVPPAKYDTDLDSDKEFQTLFRHVRYRPIIEEPGHLMFCGYTGPRAK